MPAVHIQGGARIEIPNREENRADITQVMDARERDRARGFKPIRVALPGPTPAGGTLYIPGPESGYVWNLKLVSVQLATNGTALVYINSSAPVGGAVPLRLIASMNTATTSAYVTTYSSSQVLLMPDEGIYVNATQNLNSVFLAAAEVPAEMVFRVYD